MPKFYTPPEDHQSEYQSSPPSQSNDNPIQTLLEWKAPSRPFRKRDRSFYTTIIILIVLISLIAILASQILLVGVLFAIGFVVYALNFIAPDEITYKISTQGITIGDHFYHWQELDSFWITDKDEHKILSVLTHLRFPALLMIMLCNVDDQKVRNTCAKFLPFEEIAPKSMIDKWSDSLQKHFPLENPHR